MTVQDYRFNPRAPIVTKTPFQKGSVKTRILDKVINTPRGITADELEMRLGIRSCTITAAINAMLKSGMIIDSGEKRPTRSGRMARVYLRRKPRK